MPYVCGTYRDKRGTSHHILGFPGDGEKTVAECRSSICWQLGSGSAARACNASRIREEHDMRTEWHIVDPEPQAFLVKCRVCGRSMTTSRGGLTRDAWHALARELWGDKIPLTVAELRLNGAPD